MEQQTYTEPLIEDGGTWSCTWRAGADQCGAKVTEMLTMPAYQEAKLILRGQSFMRVLCPEHMSHVIGEIEADQIEPEFW